MVVSPQVVLHPDGLSPIASVKARYLHTKQGYSLSETALELVNMKDDIGDVIFYFLPLSTRLFASS